MRLILLVAVLLPAIGLADQCAWTSKAHATEAQGVVTGKRVLEWCEPCGEARPKSEEKAVTVTRADVQPQSTFFELSINGKAVDLAYLYVEVGGGRWRNVAKVVGCPCTGVKRELVLPVKPK